MHRLARHSTTLTFAAAATAAALFLAVAAWPRDSDLILWFAGVTLAAIAAALVDAHATGLADRATRPVSFVVAFATLLFFDPGAMTFVAVAAVVAAAVSVESHSNPNRWVFTKVAAAIAATQAAGVAHTMLGGTSGVTLNWPWQGAPIAAAVVAYAFVASATTELVTAILDRRGISPTWARHALRNSARYVIPASIAVSFVEMIDHRLWSLVPVAAIPIYFAYRAYVQHVVRSDSEHRRRLGLDALKHAVAIVDHSGRVTLWNDALARLVGCPREHATAGSLIDALPSLARTDVPGAVEDALRHGSFRTLPNVLVRVADGERVLHVEVAPDADGATLRWQDVSERARVDRALQRVADRFVLAAEGANDGLWELDLRTQELYVSPRWRAMIGLPAGEETLAADQWFDRIHADDRTSFNESLEAHLAGRTDHIQCELRMRYSDGAYRRYLCRGVAVQDSGRRQTRIGGSLTDISDDAIAQERFRSAEFRDPLTGLCNRVAFVKGLGQRLNDLKRSRGGRFAVLYLDLDRFKVVNDSLGHLIGDELLTAVSRRLEACLRVGDALARLGGDEFAILLNDLGDASQANAIAFRIQETLSAPFSIGGREVVTSASIGIAFSRVEYANPEEIMRDADTAMYHAKAHGKARHELFDADMHAKAQDRLGFEGDLRHAIKNNEFELHYQPIVALSTGMCTGFEALVRWTRHGEPVSPAQFIPVAEELGLIEPLGTWVLNVACLTFADWKRRFPASALECVTVNVSARQLMQQGLVYIVEQAVQQAGMEPADLRIEITETALMDAPHLAAQMLRDLRDFGVKIYLDDFGTGYSSLSHLHKLPVDALKIDRSFVRSLSVDDRPAIVESILALARTLHTNVVAEGVETEAQARELERLGCRQAQGFYFSKPLPVRAVENILITGRPLGNPSGMTRHHERPVGERSLARIGA